MRPKYLGDIMACMGTIIPAEKIIEIADRAAEGEATTKILKELGIKAIDFYTSLDKHPDTAAYYERATHARAEGLVSDIIEIADNDLDSQRARNRIDVRKWTASKMLPSKYGDRVDVHVSGGIDLRAAITDATMRLRPVSDQQQVTDAQFTVLPAPDEARATDKTSDAPKDAPKKEDSIFD